MEKGGVWQTNDQGKASSSQQQSVDQHHDESDPRDTSVGEFRKKPSPSKRQA
jgi:hypothetical protein